MTEMISGPLMHFLYEVYPSFAEINIRSLLGAEQNDGKLLIRGGWDAILHSAYPRMSSQSFGMGRILPEATHQFSLTLINNPSLRHQIAEQPLTVSNSEMDVACQGWRRDSRWFLIGRGCQSKEERSQCWLLSSHTRYLWVAASEQPHLQHLKVSGSQYTSLLDLCQCWKKHIFYSDCRDLAYFLSIQFYLDDSGK